MDLGSEQAPAASSARPDPSSRLLPGITMRYYDVSKNGKIAVYLTFDGGLWLAALDRGFPPRQLYTGIQRYPLLGSSGDIYYLGADSGANYLYRLKPDSSERKRVLAEPVVNLVSISPDKQWAMLTQQIPGEMSLRAYPLRGGPPVPLCN